MKGEELLPQLLFLKGQVMDRIGQDPLFLSHGRQGGNQIQLIRNLTQEGVEQEEFLLLVAQNVKPGGVFQGGQVVIDLFEQKQPVVGFGFLVYGIHNLRHAVVGQIPGSDDRRGNHQGKQGNLEFNPECFYTKPPVGSHPEKSMFPSYCRFSGHTEVILENKLMKIFILAVVRSPKTKKAWCGRRNAGFTRGGQGG